MMPSQVRLAWEGREQQGTEAHPLTNWALRRPHPKDLPHATPTLPAGWSRKRVCGLTDLQVLWPQVLSIFLTNRNRETAASSKPRVAAILLPPSAGRPTVPC